MSCGEEACEIAHGPAADGDDESLPIQPRGEGGTLEFRVAGQALAPLSASEGEEIASLRLWQRLEQARIPIEETLVDDEEASAPVMIIPEGCPQLAEALAEADRIGRSQADAEIAHGRGSKLSATASVSRM
jgi:hypothetical protein